MRDEPLEYGFKPALKEAPIKREPYMPALPPEHPVRPLVEFEDITVYQAQDLLEVRALTKHAFELV